MTSSSSLGSDLDVAVEVHARRLFERSYNRTGGTWDDLALGMRQGYADLARDDLRAIDAARAEAGELRITDQEKAIEGMIGAILPTLLLRGAHVNEHDRQWARAIANRALSSLSPESQDGS